MRPTTPSRDLSRLRQDYPLGGGLVPLPMTTPARPGLLDYIFASSGQRDILHRQAVAAEKVEIEQIEAVTRTAVAMIAIREDQKRMAMDEEHRKARIEAEHRLDQDQALAEQASGRQMNEVALAITLDGAQTSSRIADLATKGQISRDDAETLAQVNEMVKKSGIQRAVDRYHLIQAARESRTHGVLAPRDPEGRR